MDRYNSGVNISRSQRGFTLTELGIVIGVIAVMMTVVFVGRGMLTSARIGNCVQLVRTIRDGARSYAMRTTGGVAYTGISIVALQNQQILPAVPITDLNPFNLGVSVAPLNAPLNDRILIEVCVPSAEATADLMNSLQAAGGAIGAVTSVGNCVRVDTR